MFSGHLMSLLPTLFFFLSILSVKTKVSELPLTYIPQLEMKDARAFQSTLPSSLSQNPTCHTEGRL